MGKINEEAMDGWVCVCTELQPVRLVEIFLHVSCGRVFTRSQVSSQIVSFRSVPCDDRRFGAYVNMERVLIRTYVVAAALEIDVDRA